MRTLAVLLAAATLVACESESDPAGPDGGSELALNEIVVRGPLDASSTEAFAYFSFAEGGLVDASGEWDIALRRYEVRLNGGVSGSRGVTGFSLDNNVDLSEQDILALTAQGTLADFDAVREADIPPDGEFTQDRLIENTYGYLSFGGVPTANASQYWKVRTASGAYALVRVASVVLAPPTYALTSITFDVRAQNGASLGAPQQITATSAGGAPIAVSLATNAGVEPNGCNWDFQVSATELEMTVNSACNVGTYPGPSSPTFEAATAAADAPEYAPYLADLTGPIPNSFSDPAAPFLYNLAGDNRLSPTFNTYLVKVGSQVFKVQFIGYYSEAGASGWPTIRYARIR